jgi:hypothetical protein
MAHLFLVLLARQRQYQQEDTVLQMHNYSHTGTVFFFTWSNKFSTERPQALLMTVWTSEYIPAILEYCITYLLYRANLTLCL